MQEFLENLQIKPALQVQYHDGSHDQSWAGPPEDWLEHVAYHATPYGQRKLTPEEVREGVVDGVELDLDEELGWRVTNYDVTLGRYLHSDSSWSSNLGVMTPYEEAMRVLRQQGYRKNPRRRLRLNPSADQALRQAERILASDPGLLRGFLGRVLFDSELPKDLARGIYWEFMRLNEGPFDAWELTGPGGQQDVFGTRFRAIHEGAWRAYQVFDGLSGYEAPRDHVQDLREGARHGEAVAFFNQTFPVSPIRIRKVVIR
jgi:hypothetical protein